jgi:prephenate dehydrogenase
MRPDTLGVIGLGAIGGSVAWQSAIAGIRRVLAYTPRPAEGVAAVRVGAVTELASSARFVMQRADLLVLATPPAATIGMLAKVARNRRADTWCTDVTSVKGPVVEAARRHGLAPCFAGSHPYASTTRSGFAAADPARFRGAVVYVSPVDDDDRAAREIADFWTSVLEAHCVIVDPDDHDAILAWTSHLPQVVGSALAHALATHGPRGVTYGDGGRDTTRLAQSSVELWRDILLMNREPVLEALEGLESSIGTLRRALLDGDARAVAAWLERGARWRERLGP